MGPNRRFEPSVLYRNSPESGELQTHRHRPEKRGFDSTLRADCPLPSCPRPCALSSTLPRSYPLPQAPPYSCTLTPTAPHLRPPLLSWGLCSAWCLAGSRPPPALLSLSHSRALSRKHSIPPSLLRTHIHPGSSPLHCASHSSRCDAV